MAGAVPRKLRTLLLQQSPECQVLEAGPGAIGKLVDVSLGDLPARGELGLMPNERPPGLSIADELRQLPFALR
jgi:hypothetical protein